MVKHLLSDLARFEEELSREHYLQSSGQKDELESAKIFDKFPHLFSKKHISVAANDIGTREGKLLWDTFLGNFIGNKLKKLTDDESSFESAAQVEVAGHKVPFRQVSSLIMNEDDRKKRKAWYVATKQTKRALTKFEKRAWKKLYGYVEQLSGRKYLDHIAFVKEVDYVGLASQLQKFLVATDELHKLQLEKNMRSIGVKKAMPYDYAYFARAKPFDVFFKKEKLVPMAKLFWKNFGFDIDVQKNVMLDVEERPKKVPRAFCMPIRVPEEVVLVIKPQGGQDDYQAFLHESGHTEHFANTRADLAYELRHMGAHSVSESYAFLIEYLMANPLFLQRYVEMPASDAKRFCEFIMEQKLQAFRRYAVKVIYELKLHGNNLQKLDDKFLPTDGVYENAAEMYVDLLTKATKIQYAKESYLLDVDSGLYAADYVRAWLFEAMLRKKLELDFGKTWFENKSAGEFLKSLWQWGSSGKSVEELVKIVGYEKLDIKYLTDDFLNFFAQ